MPLPKDIDGLSPAELKSLVLKLLEKVAELERTVAAQRDEIARLKGGPPRPNIKAEGHGAGEQSETAGGPAIGRNSGDGERDRSCCSPLFCDLPGHLLQKCGGLFDVVGRCLGRTEHARRLRLDRAQHVNRLLERRDVDRFRRSLDWF